MAQRYDQMHALIDELRPRRIVEVGVHRGIRAAKLCARALLHWPAVDYVGYDVFDTMDDAFQDAALNGKGAPSEADAARRLSAVEGATFRFVVGDTRETLHGALIPADFAFIDGDHRVDAIAGDYAALATAPCVVFDDYYVPDARGACPDLTRYGANQTVNALRAQGRDVVILPVGDACNRGGEVRLAVVR